MYIYISIIHIDNAYCNERDGGDTGIGGGVGYIVRDVVHHGLDFCCWRFLVTSATCPHIRGDGKQLVLGDGGREPPVHARALLLQPVNLTLAACA